MNSNLVTASTPYDFCCPSVQKTLDAQTCPYPGCNLSFPSIAAMVRHRRKLHPRTRARLAENWSDLQSLVDDSLVSILKEGEDDDEFLCLTTDGSLEWTDLDVDSPLVKEFRKLNLEEDDAGVMRVDVKDWAKGLLSVK